MDIDDHEKIPFIDSSASASVSVVANRGSPIEEIQMDMNTTRANSNLPQARATLISDPVPRNPLYYEDAVGGSGISSSDLRDTPILNPYTLPDWSVLNSDIDNDNGDKSGPKHKDTHEKEGETTVCVDQADRKNSFKHPMHCAAEEGNVKELERLLIHGDPLTVDFKKRTPLHYACGFAYQKKALKMVDIILNSARAQNTNEDKGRKKRLLDSQDKNGQTGLHIAAKTGHPDVVEKLLFSAADVNLRDKSNTEPLQLIYHKVPTAMIPVFDGAVSCKVGDPNDQNLTIELDFGSIVGYSEPEKDNSFSVFQLETKLLSYCLQQSEQKRSAILLHPVVQTFLQFKWKKIRILLWLSILYHVIWLLLYTIFIVDLYLLKCPYKLHEDSEDPHVSSDTHSKTSENFTISDIDAPNTTTNHTTDLTHCEVGLFLANLSIELGLLYIVSASVVLKEIYEIYSILTTIPVFFKNDENAVDIHSWQYQAAAFGMLLSWTLILSQIGKVPRFGIYIEILVKVLRSFVAFMVTFASLLVAFLVSFQILMPKKVVFENFGWGFIKVLVMMIGEINYDEVFYGEDTSSHVPFPTSTKILYAIFVAIVTIILFNLLIGLTVSDIQGLQSVAQLSSLSSQLEQIYLMEKFIISKRLQGWLKSVNKNHWLRYFLVTQQHDDTETNMGIVAHISAIPRELQHKIREIAAPNTSQQNDENDDLSSDTSDSSHTENASILTQSKINMREELKEEIKDILREILDEMKANSNN